MSEEIRKKIGEKYPQIYNSCPSYETLMGAAEFGYQLAQEEKKFKPCGEGDNICSCKSEDECGYLESQDELWGELDRKCIRLSHTGEVVFLVEEAKKSYQISKKRQ